MKVIYVGPLYSGGTCLQRLVAMKELGHEVIPIDTEPQYIRIRQNKLLYRILKRLIGVQDLSNSNKKICDLIQKRKFDIIWLDKALTITSKTINFVKNVNPSTIVVGYSPDDMAGKHNQSNQFLKSLPFYHIYFTTKSYGIKELEFLGAKKAIFIGNAYDPHTHRPMKISFEDKKKYGGFVGFIGDYEEERAECLYYLASKGIPVRIWGHNWTQIKRLQHSNMMLENKPLWGDEYAKAICSFDINLGFLRKINRDLQTQRTIEIPACGAFMIMERTEEQLELFVEGEEAVFFNTKEELLKKVSYYLINEKERNEIARKGRERCLKSGYSNHDRLKQMFAIIKEINGKT